MKHNVKQPRLAPSLCHFQPDALGVKNGTPATIIFPTWYNHTVLFLCPSFDSFSCPNAKSIDDVKFEICVMLNMMVSINPL